MNKSIELSVFGEFDQRKVSALHRMMFALGLV